MKTYKTLYSKDSTGKIRIWFMQQDNNKYRTISGIQDSTKLVTSEFTICNSKNIGKINETSGEKQAEKEISAAYKKQLKTGYFENIQDVNKETFIQPMLCKKFTDRLNKIEYPVYVDRKYNGGRVITTKSGCFTRTGEKYYSIPHIFESVKHLFIENTSLVIDGEAYNHEYRYKLSEIMRLIRKSVNITSDDLTESKIKIKYYIYDAYGFNGITQQTPFLERRKALTNLFKDIPEVVIVDHKIANNEEEIWQIYQSYIDDGYEGAVVKINGSYENKRSSNSLKMKPEDDDEAIIIDIKSGNGNWANSGKIITLRWKDKIFDATFKGTYEDCVQFLKDKDKWIGKEVTFLYNGLTSYNIPNYARVDFNNCIKK